MLDTKLPVARLVGRPTGTLREADSGSIVSRRVGERDRSTPLGLDPPRVGDATGWTPLGLDVLPGRRTRPHFGSESAEPAHEMLILDLVPFDLVEFARWMGVGSHATLPPQGSEGIGGCLSRMPAGARLTHTPRMC